MKKVVICVIAGILCVIAIVFAAPGLRAGCNLWNYGLHKIDDVTTYDTRKEVEDTCRAMISSYESDRLTWLQYKDKEGEQLEWAESAKMRANKTAVIYNEYILKNSFKFEGNIPKDVREILEVLE